MTTITDAETHTPTVLVKPLEWEVSPADKSIGEPRAHYGYWVGGYYAAGNTGKVWRVDTFTNRGKARHLGYFDTLTEAKAAAQADYEERIRSALTAASAPDDRGAGVVLSAEDERLCFDRGLGQWRASLKRPDMAEEDRVKGALLAYQRQAFALSLRAALAAAPGVSE